MVVVWEFEFCVVCCADVWVDAGVGVDVGVVVWVIVDCWSVEVFETGVGVGVAAGGVAVDSGRGDAVV